MSNLQTRSLAQLCVSVFIDGSSTSCNWLTLRDVLLDACWDHFVAEEVSVTNLVNRLEISPQAVYKQRRKRIAGAAVQPTQPLVDDDLEGDLFFAVQEKDGRTLGQLVDAYMRNLRIRWSGSPDLQAILRTQRNFVAALETMIKEGSIENCGDRYYAKVPYRNDPKKRGKENLGALRSQLVDVLSLVRRAFAAAREDQESDSTLRRRSMHYRPDRAWLNEETNAYELLSVLHATRFEWRAQQSDLESLEEEAKLWNEIISEYEQRFEQIKSKAPTPSVTVKVQKFVRVCVSGMLAEG